MYWKPAAKRIFEYNPTIKLIFILRNPIERAFSNYCMHVKRKKEFLPFIFAILIEPFRQLLFFKNQNKFFSYIKRGFYAKQIKKILQHFPQEQMLFLKTEDLLTNHQETLNKIFEFLEIPCFDDIEQKIVFSNNYPKIGKFEKKILQNVYKNEIEKLEKLLLWDITNWKK